MISKVLIVHLLACGVVGRTPPNPLARYRDVMTTQGIVRGYYAPHPPHYTYLGIPYARPPTRYDRFKAPKPTLPWSGIFEATHRVKCPQPDGSGDENCLVVNVFTPENATLLPVIVHFHDGVFQKGWGSFKVPLKLLERSFVFVSFNFRLGILGFLCLRTEAAPGNAGLKDQVAALYWVQRNIAKFGGNPLDVTVYGTGTGAASIEILLLSGSTTDLFQKAIIESGSVLSPTTIKHDPITDVINLATSLGIQNAGVDTFEDIYQLPVKKLVNSSTIFLPCVEKELRLSHSIIDKDPRDVLRSKLYQHIPMMIVYTNAEEVTIITGDDERFQTIPEDFQDLLPHDLVFEDEGTKRKVAKLVKDFYFAELELTESIIHSYVDFINDVFVEYPVVKWAANYASNGNPVYLMNFAYKGNISRNKKINIAGASPGDIFLYFSHNDFKEDYDEVITERLVTLWTNFIKLG
ncbi:esterase FE4-like [Vanessa atalanta]|uniref:esterase FE4-like n=1 Tax=Vanessa atalanta TaxID=42275 RepID=UPI001FCCF4F9|nr:esterase FE4-like [Vanessa atalanta]